jgi:hypothetical protein
MDWQHLFVAWGLGWWLLTAAFLAGSFALVACKRGAYFLLSLLLYLGLVQFLGNTPVLEFIEVNYPWILGLVAGFFAVSIFWFNWRWHWLTAKMRGRYNEVLGRWCHENGLKDPPPVGSARIGRAPSRSCLAFAGRRSRRGALGRRCIFLGRWRSKS